MIQVIQWFTDRLASEPRLLVAVVAVLVIWNVLGLLWTLLVVMQFISLESLVHDLQTKVDVLHRLWTGRDEW